MRDYPYFIDVRGAGLNEDVPFVSELPQLTVAWASPVDVDEEANAERAVTTLFTSSPVSWRSASTDIMPNLGPAGDVAYLPEGEQKANALAVMVEGRFQSFFEDSPLMEDPAEDAAEDAEEDADASAEEEEDTLGTVTTVIGKSPESARLIVMGSASFLADQTVRMIGSADGTVYTGSLQLMANVVDWSVEDQSLLGIRSRGQFNRTLPPLAENQQRVWEYANYAAALVGLAVVYGVSRRRRQTRRRTFEAQLGGTA